MGAMLTKDAIAHFNNSQAELARALGIKPQSVTDWGDTVPKLRQLQLERITGGMLKAAPDVFGVSPTVGEPAHAADAPLRRTADDTPIVIHATEVAALAAARGEKVS